MKPTRPAKQPAPVSPSPAVASPEARQALYDQTMTNIRHQLSKSQAVMSRVLHGRVIEVVTEFLEETLYRPSIVIGGLLGAVIVTAIWYGFAVAYGFALSGSELPIGFGVGAVFGFVIERLSQFFRRHR